MGFWGPFKPIIKLFQGYFTSAETIFPAGKLFSPEGNKFPAEKENFLFLLGNSLHRDISRQ